MTDPHIPGDGIEYFKADIETGELTLRLAADSCRFVLTAADLRRTLTEPPRLPEKNNPPGSGRPGHDCIAGPSREHRREDLAFFHSAEWHSSQRWFELAVDPNRCTVAFPADLALRLFYYASQSDNADGMVEFHGAALNSWFHHPMVEPSALAEGLTVLDLIARPDSPMLSEQTRINQTEPSQGTLAEALDTLADAGAQPPNPTEGKPAETFDLLSQEYDRDTRPMRTGP